MKLRSFSTEANQVINSICLIDTSQPEEMIKDLIEEAVGSFRRHIRDLEVKDKFWQLKKNEFSLFNVFDFFFKDETKRNKEMVDKFIALKSNEVLNDYKFILVAISLGLIILELEEVDMLINANNKIS